MSSKHTKHKLLRREKPVVAPLREQIPTPVPTPVPIYKPIIMAFELILATTIAEKETEFSFVTLCDKRISHINNKSLLCLMLDYLEKGDPSMIKEGIQLNNQNTIKYKQLVDEEIKQGLIAAKNVKTSVKQELTVNQIHLSNCSNYGRVLGAFMLRMSRLQTKLVTFDFMSTYLAPSSKYISHEITRVLANYNNYIIIAQEMHKRTYLELLAQQLSQGERTIRGLLDLCFITLLSNHKENKNIPFSVINDIYIANKENILYDDVIKGAIESVAPPSVQGIAPDHYYVFRLLYFNNFPLIFDPNQYKQWVTYRAEIITLLFYLTLPYGNGLEFKHIANWNEGKPSINIPFEKFISFPCSQNTYSSFITYLNNFMLLLWKEVHEHIKTYVKQQTMQKERLNLQEVIPPKDQNNHD